VKDRIVFLGPTYDRGDVFSTPWGKIPGVALHASAAAYSLDSHAGNASIDGGGFAAWAAKWLIKALLACIVAYCFYRFRPLFATLAEWGLFHLNAGPFLIALWLEQVVESSLHHKRE
jgi:CHASE2 domain-containing sensor protein